MCFIIQKHAFVHFLNDQNLLIEFNQIDIIVSKSLVKHIYSSLLITVLKNVENFQKANSAKEALSTLNKCSMHR